MTETSKTTNFQVCFFYLYWSANLCTNQYNFQAGEKITNLEVFTFITCFNINSQTYPFCFMNVFP